jgi:hypothetical protein
MSATLATGACQLPGAESAIYRKGRIPARLRPVVMPARRYATNNRRYVRFVVGSQDVSSRTERMICAVPAGVSLLH